MFENEFFQGLCADVFRFGVAEGFEQGLGFVVVDGIHNGGAGDGLVHGVGSPEIESDAWIIKQLFVEDEVGRIGESDKAWDGRSGGSVYLFGVEILSEERAAACVGPVSWGKRLVRGVFCIGRGIDWKNIGRHQPQISLSFGKTAIESNEFDVEKSPRHAMDATRRRGLWGAEPMIAQGNGGA